VLVIFQGPYGFMMVFTFASLKIRRAATRYQPKTLEITKKLDMPTGP